MATNKKTFTTQIKTNSGSSVRIDTPKGRANKRIPKVSVVVGPDEVVGGFVNFLREKAVVGLAVGFLVGQQVQGFSKQLIEAFIDPAFKMFFGEALSKQSFYVAFRHGADFKWGAVIYSLLNFLFVLIAIYATIKLFKLDKLDLAKDSKKK